MTNLERLDRALKWSSEGRYGEALEELRSLESLSTHPRDIATLKFLQAGCLTDLGRVEDAAQALSAVDLDVLGGDLNQLAHLAYNYELARIERAKGNLIKALDLAAATAKTLDTFEDSPEVETLRGNLMALQGVLLTSLERYSEAIPVLERVSKTDAGWDQSMQNLGQCYFLQGHFERAIECYQRILSAEKPVDPIIKNDALRFLGYSYYRLGKYAYATDYFRKVENQYDAYPEIAEDIRTWLTNSLEHIAAEKGGRGGCRLQ